MVTGLISKSPAVAQHPHGLASAIGRMWSEFNVNRIAHLFEVENDRSSQFELIYNNQNGHHGLLRFNSKYS